MEGHTVLPEWQFIHTVIREASMTALLRFARENPALPNAALLPFNTD
jgi:hypothetical protein